MCRLLGLYGYNEAWKKILLEFRTLAESGKGAPHQDGWGLAKSNEGNYAMSLVDKQLGSAYQSQKYQEMVKSLVKQPEIFLCHLRKASRGIPITLANTQPFITEKWAFIHNGTIYEAESLPRNPFYVQTSDKSDTESFFHFLLTNIANKKKNGLELTSLVNVISAMENDFSSINSLLCNGEELFVIRLCNSQPKYYTLFYYEFNNSILFCSEPLNLKSLDEDKWNEIPNFTALRIHGAPPKMETISCKI